MGVVVLQSGYNKETVTTNTPHVSFPLGYLCSIILGIPEYDTGWRVENKKYYYKSGDDQGELFPEYAVPLFYECPKRGKGNYILTERGEEVAKFLSQRKGIEGGIKGRTATIIEFPGDKKAA